jgi:C4-dicarboxylate-binding protein DctP
MFEVTEWERQRALELNREGLEKVIRSGDVQVHYQTEDEKKEWMEVLTPIYNEFSDRIGRDLINSIQDLNQS